MKTVAVVVFAALLFATLAVVESDAFGVHFLLNVLKEKEDWGKRLDIKVIPTVCLLF